MKISVLGCGRWGSCIAWYLDKIGHDVISSGLEDAPEFIKLRDTHKNDYLSFPDSIRMTSDLKTAVDHAEVIIISISSQYLRSYMTDIAKNNLEGKTIVLCMKGVEVTTGKRLSQVVGDFVDESKTPIAVWVGPGHPQDYVRGSAFTSAPTLSAAKSAPPQRTLSALLRVFLTALTTPRSRAL